MHIHLHMMFFLMNFWQGMTFPVAELFLEDVLEKSRYSIKSEFDNFQGSSRRRRRQQESKKDPLTELFEVQLNFLAYHFEHVVCYFMFDVF